MSKNEELIAELRAFENAHRVQATPVAGGVRRPDHEEQADRYNRAADALEAQDARIEELKADLAEAIGHRSDIVKVNTGLKQRVRQAEQKSAELAAVIGELENLIGDYQTVGWIEREGDIAFVSVAEVRRILSADSADVLSAYTTRPGHDEHCEGDFGEWGRQESPCRCLLRETQDCPHDDFVSRSVGAELIHECLDCGDVVHLWPEPEGDTNA